MADESVDQTISKETEAGEASESVQVDASEEAKTSDDANDTAQNELIESDPEAASLAPLEPAEPESPLGNLDFIVDVPLKVTVTLGTCKMAIRELLQLGQGSVIELDKLAGEPMDVHIGDRLIARGDVVVVNEKFGIRLTDIVSTAERIKYLNS